MGSSTNHQIKHDRIKSIRHFHMLSRNIQIQNISTMYVKLLRGGKTTCMNASHVSSWCNQLYWSPKFDLCIPLVAHQPFFLCVVVMKVQEAPVIYCCCLFIFDFVNMLWSIYAFLFCVSYNLSTYYWSFTCEFIVWKPFWGFLSYAYIKGNQYISSSRDQTM